MGVDFANVDLMCAIRVIMSFGNPTRFATACNSPVTINIYKLVFFFYAC